MTALSDTLANHRFHCILPESYYQARTYCFRLGNPSDFDGIDPMDTRAMQQRTHELLTQHQASLGIGRYAEQRSPYQHPQLFTHSSWHRFNRPR